jgi:hypothetical protein
MERSFKEKKTKRGLFKMKLKVKTGQVLDMELTYKTLQEKFDKTTELNQVTNKLALETQKKNNNTIK